MTYRSVTPLLAIDLLYNLVQTTTLRLLEVDVRCSWSHHALGVLLLLPPLAIVPIDFTVCSGNNLRGAGHL